MFVWFVPFVLLILAGVIFALPNSTSIPMHEPVLVTAEQIEPVPVRTPMADPPTTVIGTYAQRCSSCHRLFDSTEPTPEKLNQHVDLVHDHGLNSRCFNCHDNEDREKLVLRDGTKISMADALQLCSQCHGPTYRDWTKGIHGKTMGSWDASSGKQVRLKCTECHNPHAPAFDPMELLPGPRTLRAPLPDPSEHHESPSSGSPLQRWLHKDPPASHETEENQAPAEKENH